MTDTMEQTSCTEDRIQHVLERCLCDLGGNTLDKQLWNAGLCINRWCLEELVTRDWQNFVTLLQKIVKKAEEVLEQSQYELVVPLTLLFSSTLLKAPYVDPECGVLQEACRLFHSFLSWPEPCSSASKRLLNVIQQELRAPGSSFQKLVRAEQGLSHQSPCSKTIVVLLVSPDDDVLPEVQFMSQHLCGPHHSSRDPTLTLILHSFQAALGPTPDLMELCSAMQRIQPEEQEQLLEAVTDLLDSATSAADLRSSMERLKESLNLPAPADGCENTCTTEVFPLPVPKCHTRSWESDNFEVLKEILAAESALGSPADCFFNAELDEEDINDTSIDEEITKSWLEETNKDLDENQVDLVNNSHRISDASLSSRDSMFSSYSLSSSWSAPSSSSGVESDFSEDTAHDNQEEGQDGQSKSRKKHKKKSKSLLGIERFSILFKSPSLCRRAESMGHPGDSLKRSHTTGSLLKQDRSQSRQVCLQRQSSGPADPVQPQKHVCVRRRPILSCDEEVTTLIKVVVFGGDREVGRLARAYGDLQRKESNCPRLTKICKLQFFFVPTRRRTLSLGQRQATNVGQESSGFRLEESSTDIAHMLGTMDPWYERNVLSLLSLSSDVLCQSASKDDDASASPECRLPLLADLVFYYCRHADQAVLMQLYQVELTLAGGERRKEVFIHSLELGHSAGTRAVKAMGAASKRFGIDEEREAVPLSLSVTYNQVVLSGRGQLIKTEVVCTSVNLHKSWRKPESEQTESLQMTMTEVLKRQCPKSKRGFNHQHISVSETQVDMVHVNSGDDSTFAVCLDQDEKKFIQRVTRCEVSLCSKAGSGSDWRSYKPLPGQVRPLNPSYCSMFCLPITSFSASNL
ncbi:phosphoinositide 3-kinase regulatory subunit 5-like [Gouania willdenowi]|uniref:Phosphoinositide 3-kinase regulatory subunit 5 n=1 Tax=Gouania willdenowi TaxID=441366 RepID=A0A8C5G537_GOUWI|nr:phosphoinositide 3-kinase regulatory subunit 5-like [Gouania willdenowi]